MLNLDIRIALQHDRFRLKASEFPSKVSGVHSKPESVEIYWTSVVFLLI